MSNLSYEGETTFRPVPPVDKSEIDNISLDEQNNKTKQSQIDRIISELDSLIQRVREAKV